MSKQYKKKDLIGDFWEDEDGKKIRIKEDNWGQSYEEDEDGNKTYWGQNDWKGEYREKNGEKEYLRKDFLGNEYYESNNGEKTFSRKDKWGNSYRERMEREGDENEDTLNDADEYDSESNNELDNDVYEEDEEYEEEFEDKPKPIINKSYTSIKDKEEITKSASLSKKQVDTNLRKEVSHLTATKTEYPQLMIEKIGDSFLYSFFITNNGGFEKQNWLYASHYSEGIALVGVRIKSKINYGFIDVCGNTVTPPYYQSAGSFHEGYAAVGKQKFWGKIKYSYINKNMVILGGLEFNNIDVFQNGLGGIMVKDKWGFINNQGIIKIKPNYESVGKFAEGFASVERPRKKYDHFSKYLFIDEEGNEIDNHGYNYAGSFSNGVAPVSISGSMGYVDKNFNYWLEPKFLSGTDFNDNYAAVNTSDELFLINQSTRELKLIGQKMSARFPPKDGLIIVHNSEFKYGVIDFDGKLLTQLKYRRISPFINGIAYVEIEDKVGYINNKGDSILVLRKNFT